MPNFWQIPGIAHKPDSPMGLLKIIQDYSDIAYKQGYRAAKQNIKHPSRMKEAKKRFCMFYKISNIINIVAPSERIKPTMKQE